MRTNRDFYQAIVALCQRMADHPRSLRDYLAALRGITQGWNGRGAIALDELAGAVERAFTADVVAAPVPSAGEPEGHAAWDHRLCEQIRDLDEMRLAGTLDDPQRYFGINAPRGRRWYNFTPSGYLECGATGAFGGWEDGDEGGRVRVPGPVAVLGADGQITSADPRDLARPTVELAELSWDELVGFLDCGQCYE